MTAADKVLEIVRRDRSDLMQEIPYILSLCEVFYWTKSASKMTSDIITKEAWERHGQSLIELREIMNSKKKRNS